MDQSDTSKLLREFSDRLRNISTPKHLMPSSETVGAEDVMEFKRFVARPESCLEPSVVVVPFWTRRFFSSWASEQAALTCLALCCHFINRHYPGKLHVVTDTEGMRFLPVFKAAKVTAGLQHLSEVFSSAKFGTSPATLSAISGTPITNDYLVVDPGTLLHAPLPAGAHVLQAAVPAGPGAHFWPMSSAFLKSIEEWLDCFQGNPYPGKDIRFLLDPSCFYNFGPFCFVTPEVKRAAIQILLWYTRQPITKAPRQFFRSPDSVLLSGLLSALLWENGTILNAVHYKEEPSRVTWYGPSARRDLRLIGLLSTYMEAYDEVQESLSEIQR